MATLNDLINEHGSNAVVIADAGNGSSIGENGVARSYDEEIQAAYGAVEMMELEEIHQSEDGIECRYGSDWIEVGDGSNPYRVRFYF